MKRRFRTKKIIKYNKIVLIFFLLIVLLLLKYGISKVKLTNSKTNLIYHILNNSNSYYNNTENYLYKLTNSVKNDIFNNPIFLLKTELNSIKYTNSNNIKETINLMYAEPEKPIIYIYNSHQGENYSYKYLEEYNIVPNVLMASLMLKDKLDSIGIETLVEESDILEYMSNNNLDHSGSYIASRYFLENTISKYNSIELYIDLHRDSVTHSVTTTTIDGKECAKILFVIGLENENYENNLNLVNSLNNKILEKYPTLTRGILKKEGYGVNGVYNQDLNSNVILIEVGGYENNIEEINNTLDLLTTIIGEYLNEKEK